MRKWEVSEALWGQQELPFPGVPQASSLSAPLADDADLANKITFAKVSHSWLCSHMLCMFDLHNSVYSCHQMYF